MSGFASLFGMADEKKDTENEELAQQGATSGTAVIRARDIIDAARNQGADGVDSPTAVITLYSNGFMLGESEFKAFSNPENQEFAEDLRNGVVPRAMEAMVKAECPDATQIGVQLVDKSGEEFEEPFKAFSTAGHSMGSSAISSTFSNASPCAIIVDPSEPTTSIRVTAHDRSRHTVVIQLSNTVFELYQHVMTISNHPGPFDLLSGFPPKPLSDPSATIAEAGLKGATVTQKV